MTTFTQPYFWATGLRESQRCAYQLVTPPNVEPFTFDEVRASMRLPNNDEKAFVEGLIVGARQKLEADTGKLLITQAWDMYPEAFPGFGALRVSKGPLASVTSIKTTSATGAQSTLAASNYQVDTASEPARIVLSDTGAWPTDLRRTQPIVIRLSLGYGPDGTHVPRLLRLAMEQLIIHWYRDRGATLGAALPKWFGYDAMIASFRPEGVA